MRLLPAIAGALLGFLFILAAVMVLFGFAPEQEPPPEGSAAAHFMAAFGPTGYMTFVKILELAGGILVAIPRTRNFGLLVLGPIIVNILAYHVFVMKGEGITHPMILAIVALALYLLWCGRRAFGGLARQG